MAARNLLPPWHQLQRLRNGREVLIRPIRPEDAPLLRAGFDLLQPEQIRARLVHPRPTLPSSLAERLARPDPKREFALVAAEPMPPGEALVGAIARATIVDGSRDAEFAILVGRHLGGMGLGRHLLRRLVRWARGRKLQHLQGDVLARNQPMLALAQSLGFTRARNEDVPGLVRVELDLQA